ncbi:hypothetical protein D918_05020 [Trichuris suis]|nr:hypothetical protein D918_05020 [Trichuris suis]
MTDSETSSSLHGSLRRGSTASLKRSSNHDDDRLKLTTKDNEKWPQGSAVAEEGGDSINIDVASKPFIAVTVPQILGNSLVERTTLTKGAVCSRKVLVDEIDESRKLGEAISQSNSGTLVNLLSGADSMLTTITSTYSLSAGSSSPYSKDNEMEAIMSEERKPNDGENATDLTSKFSYSSYGFDGHESTSDETDESTFSAPKLTSDANMQNAGADNATSALEPVQKQLSLDDSVVRHAEVMQSLRTEHERNGECNTENHCKKESMLKYGELSQSRNVSEQSTSQISDTSITEALRIIAVSSPEKTYLTSLLHNKAEASVPTVQSLGEFTNQKTQAGLSDCIQMSEATLRRRESEDELTSEDDTIIAEAIPPLHDELSNTNLHTEDVPLAKKQRQNEQSQMHFGLPHRIKVMKRRSLMTLAVAQQAIQIMWFLLKGIYVLLMVTCAATIHSARLCAVIVQFIQTVYRWIINERKSLNTEEMEIKEDYKPVWMQHDSSSDEASLSSLGQEQSDELSVDGRKDLRLF